MDRKMRVEFGKLGFCKYPEYLLHHYDIIMVLCFHTWVLPGGRVGKQNLKKKIFTRFGASVQEIFTLM